MEERYRFVQEYRSEEASLAELCRRYGVSRKTGYKCIERYELSGLDGLRDQSRAPEHHPNEISPEIIDAVLDMRRSHPQWGPNTLRARLERLDGVTRWPAASTIGEILKRAGLTVPRKKRRHAPPSQSPLSHVELPNQVWCADFKGWFRCTDGSRCDPLTITDGYSRYLLRCQALTGMDEASAQGIFDAAFREYGIPEAIRTDNGEPFASVGVAGLSRLSVWWIKMGIHPERIPPGKPQHNGRHERMHRTLKRATAAPPAANLRAQQKAFDRFRQEYNHERPHQALHMNTPADYYVASTRGYPSRTAEPEYADDCIVRTIGPCGTFRWKYSKIFLGKALAKERVGLKPVEDGMWEVWFSFYPVALFDERKGHISKLQRTVTKGRP